ncbi:hypothetical protein [Bacillus sp. TL12]|uniref:hypothetical protein n=1 Tax=Bacillus sp. TL12 TaxID=2894756 RepID=UPI001F51A5FD|nr:hypothetical protein [Bacillus sp. TL12]MCI0765978.1 hypothetical protein [Bacillus sp. TL12]
MKNKHWLIIVFVCVFIPLTGVGLFNSYIDSLWIFPHKNKWNDVQFGFNERQQKTNYISHRPFHYDGVILGSSRTTFINENDFAGLHAFNYAVSSMDPREYDAYIEYAKEKKGGSLSSIVLGLDFLGTNKNREIAFDKPEVYINNARSWLYPIKSYVSMDEITYSRNTIERSTHGGTDVDRYNRDNIKKMREYTKEERDAQVKAQVDKFSKEIYGGNYEYQNMKEILENVKAHNPNTKFYIFTTPVSEPLFQTMIKEGRWNDYKRWLHDAVDVFGEVHHFMYVNSVTTNLDNYMDGHHFRPEIGKMIAHKVVKQEDHAIPKDFGIVITKENIDDVLQNIYASVQH